MEADVSVPRMQILITQKHGDASRSKLSNAPTRRVYPPRPTSSTKRCQCGVQMLRDESTRN